MQMARRAALRRQNSVGVWDASEKAQMDEHLNNYVDSQMQRLEVEDSALCDEMADEVENRANGKHDYFQIKR